MITPPPLLRMAVVDNTSGYVLPFLRMGPPGDPPSASSRISAHRDLHSSFQRRLSPH